VPILENQILTAKNFETIFRAKRSVDHQGRVAYWDGRHHFTTWDRRLSFFSHID